MAEAREREPSYAWVVVGVLFFAAAALSSAAAFMSWAILGGARAAPAAGARLTVRP